MLVIIPTWMVDDEQVVLGGIGERIRLGICADARLLPDDSSSGLTVGIFESNASRDRYRVTGWVLEVRDRGSELIVDAGQCRLVVRLGMGSGRLRSGDAVSVEATLGVIAAYEWNDFAIPDVRADWLVRSVQTVGDMYELDVIPAA